MTLAFIPPFLPALPHLAPVTSAVPRLPEQAVRAALDALDPHWHFQAGKPRRCTDGRVITGRLTVLGVSALDAARLEGRGAGQAEADVLRRCARAFGIGAPYTGRLQEPIMTFEAHRRQLLSSFPRPAVQDAAHPVWSTLTRAERHLVLTELLLAYAEEMPATPFPLVTELRDALCVLALDAEVGEAARVVFALTAEGAPKVPDVFQAACLKRRRRSSSAGWLSGRSPGYPYRAGRVHGGEETQ